MLWHLWASGLSDFKTVIGLCSSVEKRREDYRDFSCLFLRCSFSWRYDFWGFGGVWWLLLHLSFLGDMLTVGDLEEVLAELGGSFELAHAGLEKADVVDHPVD